jgi:hypothetical protein
MYEINNIKFKFHYYRFSYAQCRTNIVTFVLVRRVTSYVKKDR